MAYRVTLMDTTFNPIGVTMSFDFEYYSDAICFIKTASELIKTAFEQSKNISASIEKVEPYTGEKACE